MPIVRRQLLVEKRAKMRRQWGLSVLVLSLVLGAPTKVLAEDPAFTSIDFPGADATLAAQDVNNAGDMVGRYFIGNPPTTHGWLRSKHGEFTSIDVPGANLSHALGINDRGDIVGPYRLAGAPMRSRHGFLLRDGEFFTFDVPGAVFTQPLAINNRGDIVGRFCNTTVKVTCGTPGPDGDTHGFLMTAEGEFFTIDVPNANFTSAWKITASGQILGAYQSFDLKHHIFQISKSDLMSNPANPPFTTIDLPDPFDPALENGGINSRGDIVGWYCDPPPCSTTRFDGHGFLLSKGEFTTIDLPGVFGSFLWAINSRGDIVGGYCSDPRCGPGNNHAFLLRRKERDAGFRIPSSLHGESGVPYIAVLAAATLFFTSSRHKKLSKP